MLFMLYVVCWLFFKINFFQTLVIRMSNILDVDQDWISISADLGPNCLQGD